LHGEDPTVSDLVAAFFSKSPPHELGTYTVYSTTTVDGIEAETSYNHWDSLSVLGENGRNGVSPLIIKSINDLEVDRIPASSVSSISPASTKIDGIDINSQHLERRDLVEKFSDLVVSNFLVLLSSPSGSGKSSLYKRYKADAIDTKVILISCFKDEPLYVLLKLKGIDFLKETVNDKLLNKSIVVFLDDAQAKYGETIWKDLIKHAVQWLPSNIKFVISATHSLNGGIKSPVEFDSLARLSRSDFLLTDKEARQFLDFIKYGSTSKNENIPKFEKCSQRFQEKKKQKIDGEVDFYLNGNLRWGIELLFDFWRVGEHISRFCPSNGKYISLDVTDYAVVDCRSNLLAFLLFFSRTMVTSPQLNVFLV
jgi:hypothetical protein